MLSKIKYFINEVSCLIIRETNRYYKVQMPFDKIKSFWRSKNQNGSETFRQKTENFLINYLSQSHNTSRDTSEFNQLLDLVSSRKIKPPKLINQPDDIIKITKAKKLLKKIQPLFLQPHFAIKKQLFTRNKQSMLDCQADMQDQLDEIEVCLFNQISSKFDEILSVVRTIESLEFIVVDNQQKVRYVRSINMERIKMVTEKQIKIANIKKKAERIQKLKIMAQKLKEYKDLAHPPNQLTDSVIYNKIQAMRLQRQDLAQLFASHKFDSNIEKIEENLKKNYSDKLNDNIFKYITGEYPYENKFWKKFSGKSHIFEQKQVMQGTTNFLDESIINDEETIVLIKKNDTKQLQILADIKNGWKDSLYQCSKLKENFHNYFLTKYKGFIEDFRNFCIEACLAKQFQLDNPSLPNLLAEMCPKFCAKVFAYFCDLQKNTLYRYFSLTLLCFKFLELEEATEDLPISERQNLNKMKEEFFQSVGFVCRMIANKLIDLVEMKSVHSAMDITEFKELLSIFQNFELYIQSNFVEKLDLVLNNGPPLNLEELIGIIRIKSIKQTKITTFLNDMHTNALQVELKEKLENESWQSTQIPTYYYDSLHFLLTGQSLNIRKNKNSGGFAKLNAKSIMYETSVLMQSMYIEKSTNKKEEQKFLADFRIIRNDIYIKGKSFKITETILLVIQIIQDYTSLAQSFPSMQRQIGVKINEFLRSYSSSANHLIVQKGALNLKKINSKTIKSKHLALSAVCLMFILLILDFISERIQIIEIEKLKLAYTEHIDSILKILRDILFMKAKKSIPEINLLKTPSNGTQIIVSNTKILYEILSEFFDNKNLSKIFSVEILECYLIGVKGINTGNRVQAQTLKSDISYLFGQLQFLSSIMVQFQETRMKGEEIIRNAFENL